MDDFCRIVRLTGNIGGRSVASIRMESVLLSADELVDVACSEADCLVVRASVRNLGEDILDAGGMTVGVDVDVGAVDNMAHGDHLLDSVRDDHSVDVPGRFEGVAAGFGPPVVFKVMPTTLFRVVARTGPA